jgi:hypothetical protein
MDCCELLQLVSDMYVCGVFSLDKIVSMLVRAAAERFVDLVREACITTVIVAHATSRVADLTPSRRNEAFGVLAKVSVVIFLHFLLCIHITHRSYDDAS